MKAPRMRRPSSVRIGMFCRFGAVEESRPVEAAPAGRVVYASVVGGCFLQAFDGLDEFDVVAVGSERTKECGNRRTRGDFGEQFGDGFGVSGVARLDFAGMRQGRAC